MVVKEQDVFDATLVKKTGFSGKHDLTVELGAAPPNDGSHATFLLMGTGTRDKYPTIECTHEASPPPSPHAADCDLGPTYELVSSWGRASRRESASSAGTTGASSRSRGTTRSSR